MFILYFLKICVFHTEQEEHCFFLKYKYKRIQLAIINNIRIIFDDVFMLLIAVPPLLPAAIIGRMHTGHTIYFIILK